MTCQPLIQGGASYVHFLFDVGKSQLANSEPPKMLYGHLMKFSALFPIAVITAVIPMPVAAHGGGLNAEGCHTNRATGDYHCHRKGGTPEARQVARSQQSTYKNCTEARRAGAAPVRRGQPGYGRHLDRDGDGVGCE